MRHTYLGAWGLLTLLGTIGGLCHLQQARSQSAPLPAKVIADWESPQLLLRALPRSPAAVSLPSITPDGRVLLFTANKSQQGDTLLTYAFDPKSGILTDSHIFPTEQWKIQSGSRRLYASGGGWDPVPVLSPNGKKIAESLTTDGDGAGDALAPTYIFDRDPMTGRILYEKDPMTGLLSAKHLLVTPDDLRQVGLPGNTYPMWRNTSFSPDNRFVYVPVKIFYGLRNPYTMILQKELDPKVGTYEAPKLILPPGGWDIHSGVGVSNDGTYYLAGGLSKDPKDGLYVLPNQFTDKPVRVRSFKDEEVIYYLPRNPETGDPTGPAKVVRTMAKLRRCRYYDHLAPGVYPWFYRAPVAYPNSNVWLFDVEIGGDHGGELQLLAATEAYFQP